MDGVPTSANMQVSSFLLESAAAVTDISRLCLEIRSHILISRTFVGA